MCVHLCVYVYVCALVCLCVCVCTCVFRCMCVYSCVYVYVYALVYYVYVCALVCLSVCVCTCVFMCMCICALVCLCEWCAEYTRGLRGQVRGHGVEVGGGGEGMCVNLCLMLSGHKNTRQRRLRTQGKKHKAKNTRTQEHKANAPDQVYSRSRAQKQEDAPC